MEMDELLERFVRLLIVHSFVCYYFETFAVSVNFETLI